MIPSHSGSIRLFRVAGIQVFLHWTWFVVAAIQLTYRSGHYSTMAWTIAEYLALFLIVLLHEFGHSFACRQTGGKADEIVLWPLGGVAFVSPPPRPGAMLWSIAADRSSTRSSFRCSWGSPGSRATWDGSTGTAISRGSCSWSS